MPIYLQPTKDRARAPRKGTNNVAAKAGTTTHSINTVDTQSVKITSSVAPSPASAPLKSSITVPQEHIPVAAPIPINAVQAKAASPSEPTSLPNSAQARGENIRRLQDAWGNQAPIGVKPLRKVPGVDSSSVQSNDVRTWANNTANKRALPGLANVPNVVSPPSPPLTPPLVTKPEVKTPPSPTRLSRVPSTGSRPTVMDIAQSFGSKPTSPEVPASKSPTRMTGSPKLDNDPGGWEQGDRERTITPALIKAERRRSNYEKYSNFTLPVLPEEKTPASSPAGTLTKADTIPVATLPAAHSGSVDSSTSDKPALKYTQGAPQKVHIGAWD